MSLHHCWATEGWMCKFGVECIFAPNLIWVSQEYEWPSWCRFEERERVGVSIMCFPLKSRAWPPGSARITSSPAGTPIFFSLPCMVQKGLQPCLQQAASSQGLSLDSSALYAAAVSGKLTMFLVVIALVELDVREKFSTRWSGLAAWGFANGPSRVNHACSYPLFTFLFLWLNQLEQKQSQQVTLQVLLIFVVWTVQAERGKHQTCRTTSKQSKTGQCGHLFWSQDERCKRSQMLIAQRKFRRMRSRYLLQNFVYTMILRFSPNQPRLRLRRDSFFLHRQCNRIEVDFCLIPNMMMRAWFVESISESSILQQQQQLQQLQVLNVCSKSLALFLIWCCLVATCPAATACISWRWFVYFPLDLGGPSSSIRNQVPMHCSIFNNCNNNYNNNNNCFSFNNRSKDTFMFSHVSVCLLSNLCQFMWFFLNEFSVPTVGESCGLVDFARSIWA